MSNTEHTHITGACDFCEEPQTTADLEYLCSGCQGSLLRAAQSSAPLHAACEAALAMLESLRHDSLAVRDEVAVRLRAALAKARGDGGEQG